MLNLQWLIVASFVGRQLGASVGGQVVKGYVSLEGGTTFRGCFSPGNERDSVGVFHWGGTPIEKSAWKTTQSFRPCGIGPLSVMPKWDPHPDDHCITLLPALTGMAMVGTQSGPKVQFRTAPHNYVFVCLQCKPNQHVPTRQPCVPKSGLFNVGVGQS